MIKDFNCTYDNSAGINAEVTAKLNIEFPDAYCQADAMVILSKALKEYDNAVFCEMPFCHTVEAEAMGASIKLGDGSTGPRADEYICSTLEEVLALPEIEFSEGRIHQVLLACQKLAAEGEPVVLEISGPFTILNALIDVKHIFRGMRKQPELVKHIFEKIGNELLRYTEEALKYGVTYISYADSAGSVSILGPKVAEQVLGDFTYPFLKKVEKIVNEKAMVLLCPKTTFALLGTGKAKFVDILLDREMRYGEACQAMSGKIIFAGQMCMKNVDYVLESKIFKKVELL